MIVVLNDDGHIAGERRRRTFAPRDVDFAQVFLPNQISVQVVAINTVGAEGDNEGVAIRHRRTGTVAVGRLNVLMGRVRAGDFLPEGLTGPAVETKHREGLLFAAVRGGNGRNDENLFLPNNRRGVTQSRKGDLPFHVLVLAPIQRGTAVQDQAVSSRPAPLWPIAMVLIGRRGAG